MTADRQTRRWRRRRLALGLSPTPGPGLALLLVGMALGPRGLGVLSYATLDSLEPLVSLALAAFGVFVGLGVRLGGGREEWRLLRAGSLDAGVTIVVVTAGCLLALFAAPTLIGREWLVAAMLGICAASSSTIADHDDVHSSRVNDLDDILPILLAGIILTWLRASAPLAFASLLLQTAVMTALLATATVLLVRQTPAESEQRVFALGAVLLLGGVAAHLSLSALAAGLFAGLLWNVAGGAERERIARDLRATQHPLTVLLLVVAGARLAPSSSLLVLLAIYVGLRSAGKTLGQRVSERFAFGERMSGAGVWHLASPGVVGIAIALEWAQISREVHTIAALSVIVAGALVFDVLSLVFGREGANP